MITKKMSLLGLLSLAMGISACNGPGTYYYDYLNASAVVLYADGITPVADLPIEHYDWVVSYKDGSTVGVPFSPGVSTDLTGQFAFSSSELDLKSGKKTQTSCTDVCVDWSYQDVVECNVWTTYSDDYCTEWTIDEEGYDYCTRWDTSYYDQCSSWGVRTYSYCSAYAQDCDFYYPPRDVYDIEKAYAEITYSAGSSLLTTASQSFSYPGTSISENRTVENKDTIVDSLWNQDDTFVTPFVTTLAGSASKSSSTKSALSASQSAIVAARNANKAKPVAGSETLVFGPTHAAPSRISSSAFDTLSPVRKLMLEMTRKNAGAQPYKERSTF